MATSAQLVGRKGGVINAGRGGEDDPNARWFGGELGGVDAEEGEGLNNGNHFRLAGVGERFQKGEVG